MADGQKDYLLDHSYDGIEEYDNPLPGWWVWLFLITIVFSFFYGIYYHFGTGSSIHESYDLEAAAFFEQQAKQFEALEVSEALIWKQMQKRDLLAGMRKRFEGKCATCHKANASGDACPNLTDEFWIHGGDLMDIYKTIKSGVKGTEMKSWMTELGPAGVLNMAAFVGSLRGTNVAGRKPEGKKYVIKVPDPKELEALEGKKGGGDRKEGSKE